jgi:hypothetical protein
MFLLLLRRLITTKRRRRHSSWMVTGRQFWWVIHPYYYRRGAVAVSVRARHSHLSITEKRQPSEKNQNHSSDHQSIHSYCVRGDTKKNVCVDFWHGTANIQDQAFKSYGIFGVLFLISCCGRFFVFFLSFFSLSHVIHPSSSCCG